MRFLGDGIGHKATRFAEKDIVEPDQNEQDEEEGDVALEREGEDVEQEEQDYGYCEASDDGNEGDGNEGDGNEGDGDTVSEDMNLGPEDGEDNDGIEDLYYTEGYAPL
jgi:hypothetical protein